jgi:hypothetical protein
MEVFKILHTSKYNGIMLGINRIEAFQNQHLHSWTFGYNIFNQPTHIHTRNLKKTTH